MWRIRSGFTVALWTSPARLSAQDRQLIQDFLVTASQTVFENADHSSYWRAKQGVFDKLAGFALLVAPDGEVVGWGGYHRKRFANRDVLYLDAAGVMPEYQRYKLSSRLVTLFYFLERVRRPVRSIYVVLRTQNPAIHAGATKLMGPDRVFPQRDIPVAGEIRRIARETCRWLGQEERLDPNTLIVRDAYREVLAQVYGRTPTSGTATADAYFGQELGSHDAVVMIIKSDLSKVAAFAAGESLRKVLPGRRRSGRRGSVRGGAPARGTVVAQASSPENAPDGSRGSPEVSETSRV